MSHPPEVKSVELRAEWPPMRITERRETRGDHAFVAIVMLFGTIGMAAVGNPIIAPFMAFIGGYAANNWLVYNQLYGGAE